MTHKPTTMFWIVAMTALLWYLSGCWSYIIQNTPSNVANMPEVYQLIINNRPPWATASIAIAAFGGAVGSILLLLRRKVALELFILSLLGTAAASYFTLRITGLDVGAISALIMSLAMIWFAKISRQRCWIR